MTTMSLPAPTVNENPVVLEVSNQPHHKRHALEWPELASISADSFSTDKTFPLQNEGEVLFGRNRARPNRSPEDVAVVMALSEASMASHGKAVQLLREFGLHYPTDESQREVSQQVDPTWTFSTPASIAEQLSKSKGYKNESEEKYDNTSKFDEERDTVDADEIFDIIRNIQDPEHPLTLEQLGVVSRDQIRVCDRTLQGTYSTLDVRFTPTIPHCSMATQIGLCLTVKLNRSFPRFKTTVRIEPGTHASENAINKQLADKERVCAALENKHLLKIVNQCIMNGMAGEMR